MNVVKNSIQNGGVIKEPKGLMRILEWLIAILAFATATSFSIAGKIITVCRSPPNATATLTASYPFSTGTYTITQNCNDSSKAGTSILSFGGQVPTSVQFFVFVGVVAFLYALISLGIYIFKSRPNTTDRDVFYRVDFVISAILVVFWIAGAGTWAAGLNELKTLTAIHPNSLVTKTICANNNCGYAKPIEFGKANASVIFGFLNWFLWTTNLWFLYKDTSWFRTRSGGSSAQSKYGADIGSEQLPSQQPPTNDGY